MGRKKTKEEIIAGFEEVHRDRYDYSLVMYVNIDTRVKIICKTHGEYEQTPYKHLKGRGCPDCGIFKVTNALRKSSQEIIGGFIGVHGDRYDYSLVEYFNTDTKVKIICKIHGEFEQAPSNHLNGAGCPECAGNIRYDNMKVISKFKEVHGDRYDYSLVEYINTDTKVKIICKIHGEFEQASSSHLKGSGCPECAGNIRYDEEQIISKFTEVHGDGYDYSLVEYFNRNTKVKIICKIHGVFEQTPSSHLKGAGCPECAGNIRYDPEKVIFKFKEVHGDRYDYSLVEYINIDKRVKIICKIHGEFEQTPYKHLSGRGCSDCGGNIRYDNEKMITKFKEVHGDRYDYSLVEYFNIDKRVKIICKIHGEFEQTPYKHLSGRGCSDCGGNIRYDNEKIITKFKEVHADRYDYSRVEYLNTDTKVKIICKIHGEFEQTPYKHISGQGCPICNIGWSKDKIIEFVNSIDNHDLLHMDAIELQLIINQGKLPDAMNALVFGDDSNRDNTIKALKENLQEDLDTLVFDTGMINENDLLEPEEMDVDEVEESDLIISETQTQGLTKDTGLISLSENLEDLHVLDNTIVASCDEEAVEFLIQYKLRKLWNNVLNEVVDIDKLRNEQGGANFTLLKRNFFDEYNNVIAFKPPQGYSFEHKLNAMQQLTVYRMLKNKRYGNWSGTGAGKTISFIVTSRAVDARLTVLVGLNSTITQLGEAIVEVFPDSMVYTLYRMGQVFDREQSNYLILNYDKFQQGYSEELFQDLTANNRIDFIAIDEVHNVKQRTEQRESIRRGTLKRLIGRASEMNADLYVLGMSATPVINNLTEAKSLLEMITGKEYEDMNTTRTLTNALEVFKQMTLNGLRYIPKYQIAIKELDGSNAPKLKIDGTHLLEKLLKIGNQNYLGAEHILLKEKLNAIQYYLKKGSIIYSYFTHEMIKPIVEHLTNLGYRVGTFTGEESIELRDEFKEAFLHGKIDILVGSRPIGTGVDGLQKVCDRLIILSLPWTDSEYTQLKGRIYRQGSKFGEVEIIIPQVVIPLADREWSWDMQRMNLIRNKKTLADAAVDGVIPSKKLPKPETLFAKSQEALKEWSDRVNKGKLFSVNRKDLVFPLHPSIVERLGRSLGDFSEVNRTWSVSKSSTTHERLKSHPENWYYYHTLYAEKRKTWEEIPYVQIGKLIKRKDFVVADLGCGENLLRKEIPENKVLAFDHVAIDTTVTACDISKLPIENDTVDIAVFSLSLMGTNYIDYIKEAHRILKPMGFIFIAEPQAKWEGEQYELERLVVESGFGKPLVWRSSNFLYLKSEKV
ncbi:MAG: DEAD/DEAH box helicase family protein [Cyclobacteriaceae bacterium]|nr:DEAD/DEAH box helicase family protein [Cyclobacteriaceae bacterium]